jgi:broad specificity phosphatase PhoE
MTSIFVMRHGHAENPDQVFYGPEFPLSERGRRQAERLADEMKRNGTRPDTVVCSPFLRTKQTCDIVSRALGVSWTEDARLAEWDAGPWFNKPLDAFYAATGYRSTPPRMNDTRVESLEAMSDRVIRAIEDVRRRSDGTALIVSHREPLVSAMLRLEGRPWDDIHTVPFHVATVWRFDFNDDGRFLKAVKVFDFSDLT